MIEIIRANWTKLAAFIAVGIASTLGVGLYFNSQILSPNSRSVSEVVAENYYLKVADYRVEFVRFDGLISRNSSGSDIETEALKLRYIALSKAYKALESTGMKKFEDLTDEEDQYTDLIEKIGKLHISVGSAIGTPQNASIRTQKILQKVADMRVLVDQLPTVSMLAESSRKIKALEESAPKRIALFMIIIILWVLLLLCVAICVLNFYRARNLRLRIELSAAAERRAEAALADAIFTKNIILGTVSHELKTPLQTIMSSIDLLAKRMRAERDFVVVNRLLAAAERMEAQMEDLTDYARLGAGKLELRRIEFDPGELLERVANEFQDAAYRNNLDLVVRRKQGNITVVSDARRIEQIAANLITNAIKYTSKGRIQVSLDIINLESSFLQLVVEDTGPGISDEKLPTLFEPFTQLDQSTTRKYDGAGMGLAIVRKLVELFDGRIEVNSILGRGTRFQVNIPVEVLEYEPAPAENLSSTQPSRERVLLVDDNQELRVSMQDVLTEIGYFADVADGGKVALQKLATYSYDVILLDISMPEMDGFEVAAAVRASPGPNQSIPIVALSAYAVETGMPAQSNFTAHIAKPVRLETLRNLLKAILLGAEPKHTTNTLV